MGNEKNPAHEAVPAGQAGALTRTSSDEKPKESLARERRARRKEGQGASKVDDFIAAVHRMSTVVADSGIFAKQGVTIGEWSILKLVAGSKQISLAKIGKRAGISRQRMRTLLGDLEKKGFISVGRSDSGNDRRTRAITVLPKTEQAVSAVAAEFEKLASSKGEVTKRLAPAVRLTSALGLLILRNNPDAEEEEQDEDSERTKRSLDPQRVVARAEREKQRAAKRAEKTASH